MIPTPQVLHKSPYSNINVIIMANRPPFTREALSEKLFGRVTIGNKPIAHHIFKQFENCGLRNITLVCLSKDNKEYEDYLAQYTSHNNLNINLSLLPVDGTVTTGDIVRKIGADKYTFIFPIDLLTSVNLTQIIDFHISSRSEITVITTKHGLDKSKSKVPGYMINVRNPYGTRYFVYPENEPTKLVTLLSDQESLNEDLDLSLKQTLIDRDSSSESIASSEFSFEESNEGMEIQDIFLRNSKSLIVDSSMQLTNAYILSPKCVALLKEDVSSGQKIHSIESELIPYLCREDVESSQLVNNHISRRKVAHKASIYCIGDDNFAFRVTDYASLFLSNLMCGSQKLKGFTPHGENTNGYYVGRDISVHNTFRFLPCNVYGDNLHIPNENVTIQRSVIGKNCKIGKGAKITNTVLFEGVTIQEGAELSDCLVESDSVIFAGSKLRQCIVASHFQGTKPIKEEKCTVQNKQ
ncbi:translation initiation factor eIF-2B subunit gamma [Histomonas meleagridis]|uniref:translation initiation factor eIF-2B subunit gamma n=1 Tax=Histomonas meleagridis TaxID=135588 RepID=UPI00355A4D01|nr:translation initiation factor eIF-2B subunit gamma [Histomonas meleagridis]KAH0799723.1 translation initiation factor eIF-2B subunit gamma [Histomonas meleagridis]